MSTDSKKKDITIFIILLVVFLLGTLVGYGCPLKSSGSSSGSSRSDDDDYVFEPRYRDWSR